jgi:hypothetical protein
MQRTLGADLTRRIGQLVDLNDLSRVLDDQMVQQLQAQGIKGKFAEEDYERAYFACDNYGDRVLQIKRIVDSVSYFHGVSQTRGIGVALAVLGPYARWKGYGEGVDFLKEGYECFSRVTDIGPFRDIIWQREIERLNRIYATTPMEEKEADLRIVAKQLGMRPSSTLSSQDLLEGINAYA